MGEALVARYWCHMCSQMVNPVMEMEIKCPYCDSGFVEEMDGSRDQDLTELGSDRALSLWAPILLGMMGGTSRRRRSRRSEEEEDDDDDDDQNHNSASILRRRRRSSAILQLLQSLQEGIGSESDNPEAERERERERDRDRVVLINPFNQAVVLQGSFDSNQTQNGNPNPNQSNPLGDYFVGPSLDVLLQHLAENDPNRYGTPPTKKEAVEAMPAVKISEPVSCSVCLEEMSVGSEAREMPCKHRFHGGCISPWLELHSSCPVCRFQMPVEESKDSGNGGRAESGDGGSDGRRFWVPVPWPFSGLLSLSGNGSSSSSAPPNEDEN